MGTQRPNRIAYRGQITYMGSDGAIAVPVSIYKIGTEEDVVSFHIEHKCGTRVKYRYWCPSCDEPVVDVRKVAYFDDGSKAEFSRAEMSELVSDDIPIQGVIPLKTLFEHVVDGTLSISGHYMVGPYRPKGSKKKDGGIAEKQLRLMLDGLKVAGLALFVKTPIGLGRFAVVMPSGHLYTVRFEEEVRGDVEIAEGGYSKSDLSSISAFFKTKVTDFQLPRIADIVEMVKREFADRMLPQDDVKEKEPVPLLDIFVQRPKKGVKRNA